MDFLLPADYAALLGGHGPGTVGGLLRLLAPDGPPGFTMSGRTPIHPAARPWGVFTTGETCWWLCEGDDPDRWPIVLADAEGARQRLDISATEFLMAWTEGDLDPPVLSHGPARRDRSIVPAGRPVPPPAAPARPRDVFGHLASILGEPDGDTEPVDWDEAIAETGVGAFPPDYRRYCDEYGAGWPGVFFVPVPEFLRGSHDKLVAGRDDPGAFHPEPGGLLFCGNAGRSGHMWWDTRPDDPADWPVVWGERLENRGPGLVRVIVDGLIGRPGAPGAPLSLT